MSIDRSWMYKRVGPKGRIEDEYDKGVIEFLDFAYTHATDIDNDKIRCPCKKCEFRLYKRRDEVYYCLLKNGFVSGYMKWTEHGEPREAVVLPDRSEIFESTQWARDMVMDATSVHVETRDNQYSEDPCNESNEFYKILMDAEEPLWEGCKKHTKLSAVTRLLQLKSNYGLSEKGFDEFLKFTKEILPEDAKLPISFYHAKRMVRKLGLSYEKIHACPKDCILYWKENEDKVECPTCKHPRYKSSDIGKGKNKKKPIPWKVLRYLPLIPRLQRLYLSSKTAEYMRWHSESRSDIPGEMRHPADSLAWKDFDCKYPSFASEMRNVRLGLATDGFDPFVYSNNPYSVWPVFVVPYNLPPWMCMKQENIFLTLIIPGPKSPGRDIDVYLQPLIHELKLLWSIGVDTFDASVKQNFNMKAALIWTISDFPAYGMLSGWSTHGKLSCPYCMDEDVAFTLQNWRKPSYFGCHRRWLPPDHKWCLDKYKFNKKIERRAAPPQKLGDEIENILAMLEHKPYGKDYRNEKISGYGEWHNWIKQSIFFQLPYWSSLLIRHNLDVMHIEKNVFDNVFNTVMNVKGKSKDDLRARQDLVALGIRRELHPLMFAGKCILPKASYVLTKEQIKRVCEWVKYLKVPDGYAGNLSHCVNMTDCRFYGLKSHDCHVFMERFLPLAFRDLVPKHIWETLTSLSHFFRDICSKVLIESEMAKLEAQIIEVLCRLEMIFPPSFFDSMEHLPIHLAYEARVGGPVQYRWMYPFERCMFHLKKKVRNKARAEGSIVEAYIIDELVAFCSLYFEQNIETKLNKPGRTEGLGEREQGGCLSIFSQSGRPLGKSYHRFLSEEEFKAATLYILNNCEEVAPFIVEHEDELRRENPNLSTQRLEELHYISFYDWFKGRVINDSNVDSRLRDLAYGPSKGVICYDGFIINGFRFHTIIKDATKKTQNSGVLVKGSCYDANEHNYYGRLVEVVELDYMGIGNTCILFKCEWFDVVRGVQIDKYGLTDVNMKSKLNTYEPFILANQATQVFYAKSMSRKRQDWYTVITTKARSYYDIPNPIYEVDDQVSMNVYQEDETSIVHLHTLDNEVGDVLLIDVEAPGEEVDDAEYQSSQIRERRGGREVELEEEEEEEEEEEDDDDKDDNSKDDDDSDDNDMDID